MFKKYKDLPFEVYILCTGVLLTNLGSYVYPLFTFIAGDYGFTASQITSILTLFILANLLGVFISGHLTDKLGRRRTFIYFMFLSGLIYILLPLASKYQFVLMVLLAYLFSGISMPVSKVMITDLTTQNQRKEAFGLRYIALNVGFSFGPAIGSFLYDINLNILYIGDGFTTMLFAVLIALFIKETKPTDEQINNHKVRGEEKVEGSVYKVFKQRPELLYLMLFSSLIVVTFTQFTVGLPMTTEIIKNEASSKIVYGIMMAINGVTVTFFTPVVTKFMENKDSSIGLMISGLLMALGFLMYGFVSVSALMYIAAIIWSVGEVFWVVNSIAYESNHTPINHRGRVGSILSNGRTVVKLIVTFGVGFLIEAVTLRNFWVIVSSSSFLAIIVAFKLYQYNQREVQNG